LLTLGLRGNLVTDAWTASTVETLGEHFVTFDYDGNPTTSLAIVSRILMVLIDRLEEMAK